MFKAISFYKFFPQPKSRLPEARRALLDKGRGLQARGLILLAEEGVNGSCAGPEAGLEAYKREISRLFDQEFDYRESFCGGRSFRLLSVKIKKEIVNAGMPCFRPQSPGSHLSLEDWEARLSRRPPPPQLLDARNSYETRIGRFRGAEDLGLESFGEFSDRLSRWRGDKSRETLIYCTGGIRCEKAVEIMKAKGFKKVFQLRGGILNYLKKYPRSQFEGECFVFDRRAALDQNLRPSKRYALCPRCGQPGSENIQCLRCGASVLACRSCLSGPDHFQTCSKDCAYHLKKGHRLRQKPRPGLSAAGRLEPPPRRLTSG